MSDVKAIISFKLLTTAFGVKKSRNKLECSSLGIFGCMLNNKGLDKNRKTACP
jgi:hypothetical protein